MSLMARGDLAAKTFCITCTLLLLLAWSRLLEAGPHAQAMLGLLQQGGAQKEAQLASVVTLARHEQELAARGSVMLPQHHSGKRWLLPEKKQPLKPWQRSVLQQQQHNGKRWLLRWLLLGQSLVQRWPRPWAEQS
jgi:hypothetical protein